MARTNTIAGPASTSPIGKHGRIVLALIATTFLAVNVGIAYILMHHAYPMFVYPAFVTFIVVYFLFRCRLPSRPAVIGFIVMCECIVIPMVFMMASNNHYNVDYWRLLEPGYFLPFIIAYFSAWKASDPLKKIAGTFLVIGGLFIVLSFISMIPGNFIVSFLENPVSGGFMLVDVFVPAEVIRDLFLYYHLPVVLGSFGSAALLYGIVSFYTDVRVAKQSSFC
nr:hypothetical protein [Candidatus Sigynarchaeum springense]